MNSNRLHPSQPSWPTVRALVGVRMCVEMAMHCIAQHSNAPCAFKAGRWWCGGAFGPPIPPASLSLHTHHIPCIPDCMHHVLFRAVLYCYYFCLYCFCYRRSSFCAASPSSLLALLSCPGAVVVKNRVFYIPDWKNFLI